MMPVSIGDVDGSQNAISRASQQIFSLWMSTPALTSDSDNEDVDKLFDLARELHSAFSEKVDGKFKCVLDGRIFSTESIVIAHLCKSHKQELLQLSHGECGHTEDSIIQSIDDQPEHVAYVKQSEQEAADELFALQLALDEYEAQEANATSSERVPVVNKTFDAVHNLKRKPSHKRASPKLTRPQPRPRIQLDPDIARHERLSMLLSKTETILQKLQRGIQSYHVTATSTESNYEYQSSLNQPFSLTGGILHDYQCNGVKWLCSLHSSGLNGILADDMGLGKTVQVVAFVAALLEQFGIAGPHLIVVPLSTLANWKLTIEEWCLSASVIVYHGSRDERLVSFKRWCRSQRTQDMNSPCMVLTTYEIAMKDRTILSRSPRRWAYLIVDEAHRLKNRASKLFYSLRELNARRRLLLTGTPLQNNLGELWALLNFVLPDIFDNLYNFVEWFNAPFEDDNGHSSKSITLSAEEESLVIERLHSVLRPFLLRRTKAEVLQDIPNKIERVLRCPMSALQVELYKKIQQRVALQQNISYQNVLVQLRKLCNHPYLVLNEETMSDDMWESHLTAVSGKLRVLSRLLQILVAGKHKMLIFSQMTSMLDILEPFLQHEQIGYLRLDGSSKPADRVSMLKQFNEDVDNHIPVFLVSTRAGGVGLNLQAADTVIIFDSDWNPQMDLQAQSRAHRLGQTREVLVLRLISLGPSSDICSVEEVLLTRAQAKLKTESQVLANASFDDRREKQEDSNVLGLFAQKSSQDIENDSSLDVSIDSGDDMNSCIANACIRNKTDEVANFVEYLSSHPKTQPDIDLALWQPWLQEENPQSTTTTPLVGPRKRKQTSYNEDDIWEQAIEQASPQSPNEQISTPIQEDKPIRDDNNNKKNDNGSTEIEEANNNDDENELQGWASSSGNDLEDFEEDDMDVCAICGQRELETTSEWEDEDDNNENETTTTTIDLEDDDHEDWGTNMLGFVDPAAKSKAPIVQKKQQPIHHDNLLIVCDGCDASFHLKCAELSSVPQGDWYCIWCVQKHVNKRPKRN